MKPVTEAVALILFAALCVIGIIILGALHDAPQTVLSDLAFAAIGGGAGVARQNFANTAARRTTTK